MKTQKLLLVLLICSLLPCAAWAVDPVLAAQHWYTVVISTGSGTKQLTGSSPLGADSFATSIGPDTMFIKLSNLRTPSFTERAVWKPSAPSMHIMARNILYFYELSEEPKLEATPNH